MLSPVIPRGALLVLTLFLLYWPRVSLSPPGHRKLEEAPVNIQRLWEVCDCGWPCRLRRELSDSLVLGYLPSCLTASQLAVLLAPKERSCRSVCACWLLLKEICSGSGSLVLETLGVLPPTSVVPQHEAFDFCLKRGVGDLPLQNWKLCKNWSYPQEEWRTFLPEM